MSNIDNRAPFKMFAKSDPFEVFKDIKTPAFILDEKALIYNGKIISDIKNRSGVKILLAQKCFSNYNLYPLLETFLDGTEASGLYEARLGKEEMPNKECHVFSGAYKKEDIDEILEYADHIVFNSITQLEAYGPIAKSKGKSIGIRVNPECSTQIGHEIYDPCSPKSRLGVTIDRFEKMSNETLSLLDGIHFHTLCQQNSDDLEKTLNAVIDKFSKYFSNLKWLNFGGGHHITRSDYDIDLLVKCIKKIKDNYNLEVYLEPGEGIVLDAGYMLTTVLDTFDNRSTHIAILDTSAACHMPDVIECPYLPPLYNTDILDYNYTIRLGGPTCLSGDVIGEYKFKEPLKINDKLLFGDMALYTTVKTNTFNGMPLPNIYIYHKDGSIEQLTDFNYNDFKYRLGK